MKNSICVMNCQEVFFVIVQTLHYDSGQWSVQSKNRTVHYRTLSDQSKYCKLSKSSKLLSTYIHYGLQKKILFLSCILRLSVPLDILRHDVKIWKWPVYCCLLEDQKLPLPNTSGVCLLGRSAVTEGHLMLRQRLQLSRRKSGKVSERMKNILQPLV